MPTTIAPEKPTGKNKIRIVLFEGDENLVGLEIFRAGLHTDSMGFSKEWTLEELDEMVQSYNPEVFRAPLIVSHDVDGHFADPDGAGDDAEKHQQLLLRNLAFGFPKFLKRVGDSLFAYFEKIAPIAREWIQNGQITGISSSIYFGDAPTNPSPGKLALRHIALLGVDPPAVKGMSLDLSEDNIPEHTVLLSEEPSRSASEGVHDFAFWAASSDYLWALSNAVRASADMLGRMRDRIIAEQGVEAAEAVLPKETLDQMTALVSSPEQGEGLVADIRDLEDLEDRMYRMFNDIYALVEERLGQPVYQEEDTMPSSAKPKGTHSDPATPEQDATPTPTVPDEGNQGDGNQGQESGPPSPVPPGEETPPETPSAPSPAPAPNTDPAPIPHPSPDQTSASSMDALQRQLQQALGRISQLESDRNSLTTALAEQQAIARQSDWKAAVNQMKLPASILNGHTATRLPGVMNHSEGEPYTLAEFGASLGKEQGAWFRSHLESVAAVFATLHEELTPDDGGESVEAVTPEDLVQLAETYRHQQKQAGKEVDFKAALDHVIAENNLQV